MAFADFIDDRLAQARSSVAALQSIREQIEVRLSEFTGITQNTVNRLFTFVHHNADLGKDVICQVNAGQIRDCLDEEVDNVEAIYSSLGDTIEVSATEISEAFEQQVQELQIQKEFISACLDNAEVNVHTWTTNVLQKYQGMTASFVENFAQHFKCGDKIQALQSWCRTYAAKQVQNESVFISVTDRSEFGGADTRVFSIMLADFTNAIDSFFDKCWQGIQDLYGFFQRLWIGIKNLAAWLMRKAFRGLVSNLEAGDAKVGYLDMPIFQASLGYIQITHGVNNSASFHINANTQQRWEQIITLIQEGKLNLAGNNNSGYYKANATINNGTITANDIPFLQLNKFLSRLATFDEEVGDYMFRPVDVLWSGPNWNPNLNLLFRLGTVADNATGKYNVYLQIYYSCPSNIINSMTDYEVWSNTTLSFRTFIEQMGDYNKGMFPIIPTHQSDPYPAADQVYYAYFYGTPLINQYLPDETEGPVNFTNYIAVLSNTDWDSWMGSNPSLPILPKHGIEWLLFTAVLPYMLTLGPVNLYNDQGQLDDEGKLILFSTGYQTQNIDRSVNVSYSGAFKPYSYNYPYGVSVHFQSMQDRATELEKFIIITVVVAAASFITYKLVKGRSDLIAKTVYYRGQADAQTWEQGPLTPERLQQWKKLNRVARKYERLSSLFGATSNIAVSQGLSSLMNNNTEKSVDDSTKVLKAILG